MSLKLIFLLASFFIFANSSKILIFAPGFTDGQNTLFLHFAQLLANAHHQVTIFRPTYNPDLHSHKPESTQSIQEIRYPILDNATVYRQWIQETSDFVFNDPGANIWTIVSYALDGNQKFALEGCEKQIKDKNLLDALEKEKFDLAVVGSEDICAFGLVRLLQIPTYVCLTSGVLSDFLAWAAHVPSPTSYVPNTLSQFSDRMSLGQRVQNLAAHALTPAMYRSAMIEPTNKLFRKYFGKEFPNLETLVSETPVIFVNNEELIDFPRPILHKVVYIGGFTVNENKNLSVSWQRTMDNAIDGVVLISFGSVLKGSEMPLKWKMAIIKVCDKFPTYTFIWKHEEKFERANNVTNLKLASWVPQEQLLAHPKMKAFVTEGGLNSVMESAKQGVPMIIVPLFGDQMGNRFRAERHGIAWGIDKRKFKTSRLTKALENVLKNDSYSMNAKHLSKLIKQKPIKSADLILGWVDFIIEYKTLPNLQPVSLNLSLLEYLLVDALAIVFIIAAIITYITCRICYCYYWRCCETSFKEKAD